VAAVVSRRFEPGGKGHRRWLVRTIAVAWDPPGVLAHLGENGAGRRLVRRYPPNGAGTDSMLIRTPTVQIVSFFASSRRHGARIGRCSLLTRTRGLLRAEGG